MNVRLFARAKDLAGAEFVTLQLGPPATIGTVRSALLEHCPALKPIAGSLMAAVNADYASDDRVISNDCEIAFFPPVSGG